MKNVIFTLMLFLCLSSVGIGQTTVPEEQTKGIGKSVFGVGLNAGLVSGFGLSFRHHLPTQWSYQFVGGIIKTDKNLHYTLGTELQLDLSRSDLTRFFAAAGMGYFYSEDTGSNSLSGPFRMGLGIGVERATTEHLEFSGELLFTYFSDGTVLPLPQVSMHYYFN